MKIGLLGFGKSNQSLYRFLKNEELFVSEISMISHCWKEKLEDDGTEFEENGHSKKLLECDIIVKSPGVRRDLPILKEADKKGIEIINELEFTYRILKNRKRKMPKLIAVTGTNGKTTTTNLIARILEQSHNIFVGGNIGNPFSNILSCEANRIPEFVVLEISSFQALDLKDFEIDILTILNIKQDHIDWHGNFENYKLAKLKLLKHCKNDGIAILNNDDKILREIHHMDKKQIYFSLTDKADTYIDKDKIVYFKNEPLFEIPSNIKYRHNYQNTLAAIAVAKILKVPNDEILNALKTFKPEKHRLEEFLEFRGIKFINDSKATNSSATIAALESLPKKRIILILSGREKKEDFSELLETIEKKVKMTFLVGEISKVLDRYMRNTNISYSVEKTFHNAVKKALTIAKRGDYVLLSPAGASFDMFKDYHHRGETFKKVVFELTKGKKNDE